MSTWRETTIGHLLRVEHGFAFKGEHFSGTGQLVVLTPGNFHEAGGFRARPDKDRFYSGQFPDRYLLRRNDLIVAMTEQGEGLLGSSALIPEDGKYLHNQRLGLVRVRSEAADKRFLYYLFNTPYVRQQIRNSSSGAKVRHTSPERIYRVKILAPDKPGQQKVAAILSAYDDLIEANRQRIALLEKLAEEIYREWFVRLRFPSHKNVKRRKGLPDGWRASKFSELCEFQKGKTPDELFADGDEGRLPYINVEFLEGQGNEFVSQRRNSIVCADGDVLMLMDGARSGLVFRAKRGIVGSTFARVAVEPLYRDFVFEFLRASREHIVSNNTGSAIPHANKEFINRLLIFLPPNQDLIEQFNSHYGSLFQQALSLRRQNGLLRSTRDKLLPRLISGKLSVENLDIQFPPSMAEESNAAEQPSS
jgi:type I restriction enzyme, S subunit